MPRNSFPNIPADFPELLIATTNAGKVAEIAAMLADLPWRVIGLRDLTDVPAPPEETGQTFADNALLKARYYFFVTGKLSLADDSGLEVDALNGAPGVCSARYAGAQATDAENIAKLLKELNDAPLRTARFRCSVAIVGNIRGAMIERVFEGCCEGRIVHAPRGDQGFGYDPIFEARDPGRTFAELSREEKAAFSHRGQALRQFAEFSRELCGENICLTKPDI